MKKLFKGIIIGMGVAFVLGGSSMNVEAKAKARVTNVRAVSTKSGGIKVTFKKDKKAKSKKVKKYKIRVVKYTYNDSTGKWVKSGTSYKTVSAYKGKKLKSTISTTIAKKKVTDSIIYKVSIASAKSSGATVTAYSTVSTVGCEHSWYTYTKQVEDTPAEYIEDLEMRCNACDFTGSDSEVGKHMDAFRAKLSECTPAIAEAYAEEYNCTVEDFYNDYYNSYGFENQVNIFILTWMSENTEFTGCTGNGYIGCDQSSTTGKTIKTKIKDATYKTKVVTECTKCGKDRNK